MTQRVNFEQWMAKVDSRIEAEIGMGSECLPDCCYHDWYESGDSPSSAAARAIRYAMSEMGP